MKRATCCAVFHVYNAYGIISHSAIVMTLIIVQQTNNTNAFILSFYIVNIGSAFPRILVSINLLTICEKNLKNIVRKLCAAIEAHCKSWCI